MNMVKQALCATALSLAFGSGGVHAAPRDGLPQRNLLVEWRVSGEGRTELRQGGIEVGRVIIDSRRGVISQGNVGVGTVRTESGGSSVQQLMVLNGGRARLFMGRSQSLTAWQFAYSPQAGGAPRFGGYGPAGTPGVAAFPQTVWIDLGQGLDVTPRWSGGATAVVEIEAQSRQPVQAGSVYGGQIGPDGQTRSSEFASTVSVALGEWTVVARNGGSVQRSQSGTLSTREVDDRQTEQLEIRITAP